MDPREFPTKGNLMLAKNSLALAHQGYDLMDKKRNILLKELMSLIDEAKDILTKKGVSYKNIWFDSNSEAGKFTSGLFSYPTTYVVDKNGNIVGEPIVGAITAQKQAETLQKLIDQAIANSNG